MTEKETLLRQLEEYNAALERLQQDSRRQDTVSARAFARQLFHLERRVLQLQTELSVLDLKAELSSQKGGDGKEHRSLWTYLNPWNPEFHMWAYVALFAVLLLAVGILQLVWG